MVMFFEVDDQLIALHRIDMLRNRRNGTYVVFFSGDREGVNLSKEDGRKLWDALWAYRGCTKDRH